MLTKQDIALAIKGLRGARTQKSVAEAAGIDRPTWNQYEKARAMPKRENFAKLTRGLGCTLRQLDEAIMEQWRRRLDVEFPQALAALSRGDEAPHPEGVDHYIAVLTEQFHTFLSRVAHRDRR